MTCLWKKTWQNIRISAILYIISNTPHFMFKNAFMKPLSNVVGLSCAVLCCAESLVSQMSQCQVIFHHNVIRYGCPGSIATIFTEKIDVPTFVRLKEFSPVPTRNNPIPFHAGKRFLEVGCQVLLPINHCWVEGLPVLRPDNVARLVCCTVDIWGKISFRLLTKSTKTFDDY